MAAARDTFYRTGTKDEPAQHAVAITKSDSADLAVVSRAIYVGGAGDVKVVTLGGETTTFVGVPAGTVLPVRAKRVLSTGTTATNMVNMY